MHCFFDDVLGKNQMALENILYTTWEITNAYNYLMFWWTNVAQTLSISGCGDVPACCATVYQTIINHGQLPHSLASWPFNPRHFQEAVLKTTWIADVITYITQGAVVCLWRFQKDFSHSVFFWTPAGDAMIFRAKNAGLKDSCVTGSFILVHFLIQFTLLVSRWPGWFVPGDQYDGRHQFQQSDLRIAAEMPREFIKIERDPQYVWWQLSISWYWGVSNVCPMPNLPISYVICLHCQEPTTHYPLVN